MLETSSIRKNKINLSDYNWEQDIRNRTLMSNFSTIDLQILEEILFSSLKMSLRKLSRSIELPEQEVLPILKQLSTGGLLTIEGDQILVDKEIRKYFEFQITRFEPDFKPDMEFLQGLLRKVPIHYLPTWHAIPRTSNNIFESIVEKYLLSPQIFHRYLSELSFTNPIISLIISDLFSSPEFKLSSTEVISKYNLNRHEFEEILLLLEFSFVCCLTYEKEDDHWVEFISPFYEWRQYLLFLKQTETPSIDKKEVISRKYATDFSFIENMTALLKAAKKTPLPIDTSSAYDLSEKDFNHILQKLCIVKLAKISNGKLYPLDSSDHWLDLTSEEKSLYLYRHPLNNLLNSELSCKINSEKNIREAEKSVKRLLQKEWVFFDDFFKGILVPLSEDSVIVLKKTGRQWMYTQPRYTKEEASLLKSIIFEWLFEMGITIPGTCNNRDCFALTAFGKFFFNQ